MRLWAPSSSSTSTNEAKGSSWSCQLESCTSSLVSSVPEKLAEYVDLWKSDCKDGCPQFSVCTQQLLPLRHRVYLPVSGTLAALSPALAGTMCGWDSVGDLSLVAFYTAVLYLFSACFHQGNKAWANLRLVTAESRLYPQTCQLPAAPPTSPDETVGPAETVWTWLRLAK